jgi:hypothetical protein
MHFIQSLGRRRERKDKGDGDMHHETSIKADVRRRLPPMMINHRNRAMLMVAKNGIGTAALSPEFKHTKYIHLLEAVEVETIPDR